MNAPLLLINAVGLTPKLLQYAPRLKALALGGWYRPLQEVLPAVTCTAQASMLTGTTVAKHGIVANGWLFRDTNEVRFWQQNNRLLHAEPLYETAKKRADGHNQAFKSAKLFWWFNQGAKVDLSVTPKPWYGIDGSKAFDISTSPSGLAEVFKRDLGPFPFAAFWGPMSGIRSTAWIADCATRTLQWEHPNLAMVYLPHLDYEPQRFGPSGCDMPKLVKELDDACAPLLDEAAKQGYQVWVVSEYGHCDVDTVSFPNRLLRDVGYLNVRRGPFGEQLDIYGSRAFAVCDHQLAHVYVRERSDIQSVHEAFAKDPAIEKALVGEQLEEYHLNHARAGEIVLISKPNAWFAYPFWLEDKHAPDYARSVAIHHKPGFDPCELFFDPKFFAPKFHVARRLIQKMMGFRMKLDVVPLDAHLVRGSHGLLPEHADNGAVIIGQGEPPTASVIPMTAVRDLVLEALGLEE